MATTILQTLDNLFFYFGEVPDSNTEVPLQRIENTLGHFLHFTRTPDGTLTDISATGGTRVHLHYDNPLGRLTDIKRVVDNQAVETLTQYRYDEYGQLTTVIISQDPVGLLGGANLYRYAPNPCTWIDPWGWAYKDVDFTGSPDLFPVTGNQKNIVTITMQGSRPRDFTQAFKEAGIKASNPAVDDYTWHHVDDFDPKTGKTTMQHVKTSAHEATFPHGGSVSQYEKHFGLRSGRYGKPESIAIAQDKGWLKGRAPKTNTGTC